MVRPKAFGDGSEALTDDESILSLCRQAGEEGSEKDLIKNFREKYRDQLGLITGK